MAIDFKRERQEFLILDPTQDFKPKKVWMEIRWDPLTGESARIVEELGKPLKLDIKSLFREGIEGFCPFCPDNIEKVTPSFDASFSEEGKIKRGKALAFPNLRPFDWFSSVIVLDHRHFLTLSELKEELLFDAFSLAKELLNRAKKFDPSLNYFLLNWNFLPHSGGSIVHPHMHVLAGPYPSNFLKRVEEGAKRYFEINKRCFFEDLIQREKELGERYLGNIDGVCWVLAFSPLGLCDVIFIFPEEEDLTQMEDERIWAFLKGLSRLFAYWIDQGYYSFNLTLYGKILAPKGAFWVHGRTMVRRVLNSWGTSDINAFQVLQKEPVCGALPEILCKEIKPYFDNRL